MALSKPPLSTRDRLVRAMAESLQNRGYHGVGLSEILAAAEAPKGVLYHHFPGGKADLAIAAIQSAVAYILHSLEKLALESNGDPGLALRGWLMTVRKQLEQSCFERGCPLATVALESTAEDKQLREALAQGFTDIRERLGQMLAVRLTEVRARQVATLIVATYEGALMQARVANSGRPLQDSTDLLVEWVESELKRSPT